MARHINVSFHEHPAEANLISIMLAGYGELEFELGSLVGVALGGDETDGIRILYRLRSESQRLDIADALIRPACRTHKLVNAYNAAHQCMKWCKNTRNQYAHSHYFRRNGTLFLFNLEDAAKKLEGAFEVNMKPVDVPLLEKQVAYFHYTARWLVYLADELRVRTGKLASHEWQEPKRSSPPPLHNP